MSRNRLKSRTGCFRCKQRKIKCDETLPHCNQCTRKGYECPGYKRPLKWSSKYEVGGGTQTQVAKAPTPTNFITAWEMVSPPPPPTGRSPEGLAPSTDTISSIEENTLTVSHSHSGEREPEIQPGGVLAGDRTSLSPSQPHSAFNSEFQHDHHDAQTENFSSLLPQWLEFQPAVPVPTPLEDEDTMISGYYFSTVCPINSCFDSAQNFFRLEIGNLMRSCSLIYHSVLSMSAAHLASKRTDLVMLSLRHKTKAISFLGEEIMRLGEGWKAENGPVLGAAELLLATVILGMTDGWHNPSSLGTTHLQGARILLQRLLSAEQSRNPVSRANYCSSRLGSFVIGIMAYWEAMASFLLNQPLDSLAYMDSFINPDDTLPCDPNPWTGIGTPLFIHLAKVGTLGRQRSSVQKLSVNAATEGVRDFLVHGLLQQAREIETSLLHYRAPDASRISDTGDSKTPIEHLLQISQVYRLAALLELYRSFPELLDRTSINTTTDKDAPPSETLSNLLAMAISILTLIAGIPSSSGVNCLLTLPLIIAGSTLQNTNTGHGSAEGCPGVQSWDIIAAELRSISRQGSVILYWRNFVRDRIMAVHQYVGVATITRGLDILEKVWAQADLRSAIDEARMASSSSSSETFALWADVMGDERLETILG